MRILELSRLKRANMLVVVLCAFVGGVHAEQTALRVNIRSDEEFRPLDIGMTIERNIFSDSPSLGVLATQYPIAASTLELLSAAYEAREEDFRNICVSRSGWDSLYQRFREFKWMQDEQHPSRFVVNAIYRFATYQIVVFNNLGAGVAIPSRCRGAHCDPVIEIDAPIVQVLLALSRAEAASGYGNEISSIEGYTQLVFDEVHQADKKDSVYLKLLQPSWGNIIRLEDFSDLDKSADEVSGSALFEEIKFVRETWHVFASAYEDNLNVESESYKNLQSRFSENILTEIGMRRIDYRGDENGISEEFFGKLRSTCVILGLIEADPYVFVVMEDQIPRALGSLPFGLEKMLGVGSDGKVDGILDYRVDVLHRTQDGLKFKSFGDYGYDVIKDLLEHPGFKLNMIDCLNRINQSP